MEIKVNGKPVTIESTANLNDLLVICEVKTPEYVTVQLNGEFIDREAFADTVVNAGDEVEFVYFMGGGQSEFHRPTA